MLQHVRASGLDKPLGAGILDSALSDATAVASKANTDCIFFLASPLMCKKGEQCPFRHSEAARLNPRDCFFWLNHRCLKPNCPFRHPPLQTKTGEAQAELQDETGWNARAAAFPAATGPQQAGGQTTEENGAEKHGHPTNSQLQGKGLVPCIFFQKGCCAKGPYCLFLHDTAGQAEDATAAQQPMKEAAVPGDDSGPPSNPQAVSPLSANATAINGVHGRGTTVRETSNASKLSQAASNMLSRSDGSGQAKSPENCQTLAPLHGRSLAFSRKPLGHGSSHQVHFVGNQKRDALLNGQSAQSSHSAMARTCQALASQPGAVVNTSKGILGPGNISLLRRRPGTGVPSTPSKEPVPAGQASCGDPHASEQKSMLEIQAEKVKKRIAEKRRQQQKELLMRRQEMKEKLEREAEMNVLASRPSEGLRRPSVGQSKGVATDHPHDAEGAMKRSSGQGGISGGQEQGQRLIHRANGRTAQIGPKVANVTRHTVGTGGLASALPDSSNKSDEEGPVFRKPRDLSEILAEKKRKSLEKDGSGSGNGLMHSSAPVQRRRIVKPVLEEVEQVKLTKVENCTLNATQVAEAQEGASGDTNIASETLKGEHSNEHAVEGGREGSGDAEEGLVMAEDDEEGDADVDGEDLEEDFEGQLEGLF